MATASTNSPRRTRKRQKQRGQCKIWMKMRDQRHDNAAQFWSDPTKDMNLSKEIAQLKACKARMDRNPKYPGPVGIAIIYYFPNPNDTQGVPVATFDLDKGRSWKSHR